MRVFITGGSGFIGTNLVGMLLAEGVELVNFDTGTPLCAAHESVWQQGDILDATALSRAVGTFEPTHVVHLAARADLSETRDVSKYAPNIDGVRNILASVNATPSIERLVMTSTQLVCRPGYWPKHDEDFDPDTVYGQSKVITEQITRSTELRCPWTIVRPTNIWGPYLLRHRDLFYKALERGWYRHPGGRSARRCWGYVGNVCYQIRRICELPAEQVDRQVLYVGDAPFNLTDWVNHVSRQLTGRNARTIPRGLLYSAGLAGNVVQWCGLRAPLTTARYRAMTDDFLVPIERTLELTGAGPYSMEQGIDETIRWLRDPNYGTATAANAEADSEPNARQTQAAAAH